MSEPTREELVELINRVIERAEAKLLRLQNASALADKLIQLSEGLIHDDGMLEDDYQANFAEWKRIYAEWDKAMYGCSAEAE